MKEWMIYAFVSLLLGLTIGFVLLYGQSYLAGRKGAIVEPGEGVGAFIDDYVPAGHTFAQRHDDFVGLMQDLCVPDPLINVPSMPIFYLEAVIEEIIKTPFRAMHLLFPDNDPCGK